MKNIDHAKFMKRCIQIANNKIGYTYPNPTVGAILVKKNIIIGEGVTSEYGKQHAEINAINSVKDKNKIKNSILYTTLEPCCHYGSTPPCTDKIIKAGIKKVYIGTIDNSSKVNGKGCDILIKNNIQVKVGILEDKCKILHKRFLTFNIKKRPYIILKWAESEEGFMGIKNKRIKLTNENTDQYLHKIRSREHSIMVGYNTVIIDNPLLNSRLWNNKNPIKITIDKKLTIPNNFNIYSNGNSIIFNNFLNKNKNTIQKILINTNSIEDLLLNLHMLKIQSIIIEGGYITLSKFIKKNIWDEAIILKTNTKIYNKCNEVINSPIIKGKLIDYKSFFDNSVYIYKNINEI